MKKLRPQKPDFDQIAKYVAGAGKKLESARKTRVIDEEASYQLAYEAMLKVSLNEAAVATLTRFDFALILHDPARRRNFRQCFRIVVVI